MVFKKGKIWAIALFFLFKYLRKGSDQFLFCTVQHVSEGPHSCLSGTDTYDPPAVKLVKS